MQTAGRTGAFRGAQRAGRHRHGLVRRPAPHRHHLQPGSPAFGRGRAQSPDGVGREYGSADELAGGGPPAPLRGLHPQFDRGVRAHVAQGEDASGHDHAAHDHLRRLQSDGRDAGQLLPPQIRARHAFGALPGHHLQRHAARWRHDRLRRGDLLRGRAQGPLHVPRAARRLHGHDLHARRAARLRGADGGRSREAAPPQQLQHRLDELHARDHLRRDPEADARIRHGLRHRPRQEGDRRELARLARRHVRTRGVGLEARMGPLADDRRHARAHPEKTGAANPEIPDGPAGAGAEAGPDNRPARESPPHASVRPGFPGRPPSRLRHRPRYGFL